MALRLVAFRKIWKLVVSQNKEDHLVKWPVAKSNMQMSKCHLYKCQTSLAWVHKLVTHPSIIISLTANEEATTLRVKFKLRLLDTYAARSDPLACFPQ